MTPVQEAELLDCLETMIEAAEELACEYSESWRSVTSRRIGKEMRAYIARARAILKEVQG